MAMANADGGTLVIGIEDDGTITGVDYPDDRVSVILEAPRVRIVPPVAARVQDRQLEKMRILIFEVDWSAEVHQLTDGRYKLRVGDRNMPFPAQDIGALKESPSHCYCPIRRCLILTDGHNRHLQWRPRPHH